MQKYLNQVAPDIFDTYYYPGENIKKLLTRAERNFEPGYHKAIVVMGGICGITHRDEVTKVTHIRSYDIDRTARKFEKSLVSGKNKINDEHPDVPIIVAPTIGIDLSVYNRAPADIVEQHTLDQTIMAVNKVIINSNGSGIKVPWISKKVHHCRGGGKWTHRYQYLKDGCHFNRVMKKFVAWELAKCLTGL